MKSTILSWAATLILTFLVLLVCRFAIESTGLSDWLNGWFCCIIGTWFWKVCTEQFDI